MSADVSETLKARKLGLSTYVIQEIIKHRKCISAGFYAQGNAHKPSTFSKITI